MNMNTTRNLSFYSISLFLSLAAAFGSANAAFAQKAKKNKKTSPAQTVASEAAPAESVIVNTNTIDSPNDQYVVPQINNQTEEALNAQLQTKLKFTPYTRTAPVKPNVFGNYPNIKNAPAWDGREPGNYSIRFKIKTITPPKATPKITNIYAGDTVYLADHNIGGKYLRDTAVIDKNGVANFVGTKKLQRGMYLFVFPKKRDYFEFIIDDDLDFQIDFDTAWSTRDYYKSMTVAGSTENAAFVEYQKGKVAVIEKLMAIDEVMEADSMAPQSTKDSLNAIRDQYLNEKGNYDSAYILKNPGHLLSKFLVAMINIPYPEVFPTLANGTKDSTFPLRWYKNHYLDHMDFGDDGLLRMPVNIVKQRLDFYFDKIIVPDADTCMMVADKLLNQCKNTIEMEKYLIWYLTNRFESSNIMGLDRAFVRMAMSTYCQGKSWWVDSTTINKMCENAFRRAHTLIGETAPELELKDIKGNWVNTQKIRGPYVVMIFWDPTCGHCKEVMPKLAKIYEANKDKGWKVIALSSGDKKKEWEEYYNTHPETQAFTHLIRGEVQSQKYADALYSYYVVSSPTIYVLDADRKIVANRIDVDKMVEFLKHLDEERDQKAAAEKK
jgi:peroxiredoxin